MKATILNLGIIDLFNSAKADDKILQQIKGNNVRIKSLLKKRIVRKVKENLFLIPLVSPKPEMLGAKNLYMYGDTDGNVYDGLIFAETQNKMIGIHRTEYGSASISKLYSLHIRKELQPHCIGVGLCGSVNKKLRTGDVLIPKVAFQYNPCVSPEEIIKMKRQRTGRGGTLLYSVRSSDEIRESLLFAARKVQNKYAINYQIMEGNVLSSYYDSEDEEYLHKNNLLGKIDGLDCESYTLLKNAGRKKYNIKMGIILIVSNEIYSGQTLDYINRNDERCRMERKNLVLLANKIALEAAKYALI